MVSYFNRFELHFQPSSDSETEVCVKIFNTTIGPDQLPTSVPTIQRISIRTVRESEIQASLWIAALTMVYIHHTLRGFSPL